MDKSFGIEHEDVALHLFASDSAVSNSHANKKCGNTNGSRTSANEDDLLVFKSRNSWDSGGRVDGRGSDGGSSFDIIVEAVAAPAEVVKKAEGSFHLEVFELDKAGWAKDIVDSFDEFFNNWKFFFVGKTRMMPAMVEWIVDDFFAVGSNVKLNWKSVLWWNSADESVENEFANWNTKTRCTKITKSKNTATICDDNAADVLARIVAENLFHVSFVFWSDVDAAIALAVGGPLHAGFTNSGGVENGHGLDWWIGVEEVPEGLLVLFAFVGKENVFEHWSGHEFELTADTGSLFTNGGNFVWKKTTKMEAITLFTSEGCTFAEIRVFEKINSNFANWKCGFACGKCTSEVES